jgi:hypothetical protein
MATADVDNNNGPETDFYMNLRDTENRLDSEIESMQAMPEADIPFYRPMIEHVSSLLRSVLYALRSEQEPEKVFAAAIGGLNRVEQEQFILENILESLKRGDELSAIMDRFQSLGLFETNLVPDAPPPSPVDQGSFLMRLRMKLGKSAMVLAKVALSAARAAGKFVDVVPVVGFVGPVPTISLQLQPKGASVDEVLELVMGIIEQR